MKYLIASFVSIGLIGLGVWSHFVFFRVRVIQCVTTTQQTCPDSFMQALTPFEGQSLFLIQPMTITQSAELQSSGYQVVAYQKKLPNQLFLTVRSEKPLFTVQSGSENQTISEYGRVIQAPSDQVLPLIIIDDGTATTDAVPDQKSIQNGSLVEPYQTPVIQIISEFKDHPSLKISTLIWKSPQEIEIKLDNNIRVLVDTSSYGHAARKTTAILASEKVQSEVESIQEIDLRLDLPVLRTSQ